MVGDLYSPPAQLAAFQTQYSAYLRGPYRGRRPAGVPRRRSRVYESLVFNNVCGFIDKCFPVSQTLLSSQRWSRLCRAFFRDWSCSTPYFGQIPYEFVQFVQSGKATQPLPRWFAELIHYEWIELNVELHPGDVGRVRIPCSDDYQLALNPTLQNLRYQWPVHRICADFRPRTAQPVHLLVYRNFEHAVRFMEINQLTATVLDLYSDSPLSPLAALEQLVPLVGNVEPDQLLQFGQLLLSDLLKQNVLLLSDG